MDSTIVHFEIPADNPERAAKFYRELFGWKIDKWENPNGIEYWMVQTVPTNEQGMPERPENSVLPLTRAEWSAWLEQHLGRQEGVWMVFY